MISGVCIPEAVALPVPTPQAQAHPLPEPTRRKHRHGQLRPQGFALVAAGHTEPGLLLRRTPCANVLRVWILQVLLSCHRPNLAGHHSGSAEEALWWQPQAFGLAPTLMLGEGWAGQRAFFHCLSVPIDWLQLKVFHPTPCLASSGFMFMGTKGTQDIQEYSPRTLEFIAKELGEGE